MTHDPACKPEYVSTPVAGLSAVVGPSAVARCVVTSGGMTSRAAQPVAAARQTPEATTVFHNAIDHSPLSVIQRGFHVYSLLPPEARESLHSRTRKRYPLRAFAKQLDVPVSTLWRWLATYLLYRRFPEIAQYQHLGVAHLSIILGVESECQLYFLRMAEIKRWSRRALEGEVRRYHVAQERARREAEAWPHTSLASMPAQEPSTSGFAVSSSQHQNAAQRLCDSRGFANRLLAAGA